MSLSGGLLAVLTAPFRRLLAALSARPLVLVGLLGTTGGVGHLAAWTALEGSGWATALGRGEVLLAAEGLGAYAVSHPAYLLLALAGLVLVARGN